MRHSFILAGLMALLPRPQVLVQELISTRGAPGFGFSRSITIDHTKVPNTDQTSFPVAVAGTYTYLKTVGNGGKVQNSSGFDIIFTSDSAGQNRLDCELESYAATTGAVAFWVRIPTLSHTVNNVIYLWYGNSGISTSQCVGTTVWDSNYVAVWHNKVNSSGVGNCGGANRNICESTASAYTLTGGSGTCNPTLDAGIINGQADTGVNGCAWMSSGNKLPAMFNGSNQVMTLEGWFANFLPTDGSHSSALGSETPATNATFRMLVGNNTSVSNLFQLIYMPANWFTNTYHAVTCSTVTIGTGTEYHVTVVMDLATTSNSAMYINGSACSTPGYEVFGSPSSTFNALGNNFFMGCGPEGCVNKVFAGRIDELRFSKVARSADWVTTSYNNQSSPATFYAVGSEVPH